MSLAAFSPLNTPVVGSGTQAVLEEEYAGACTVIWNGLTTVKFGALTPPNVTFVAPVKPEPRIVIFPGAVCRPPVGLTAFTLGIAALVLLVFTYSKVEDAPGTLDTPFLRVTSTLTGPAPF